MTDPTDTEEYPQTLHVEVEDGQIVLRLPRADVIVHPENARRLAAHLLDAVVEVRDQRRGARPT